ncbi:hypothetical protein [Pseudoneobacillus sp. C159]
MSFIRYMYVSLVIGIGIIYFLTQLQGGFMNISFIIWIPVLGSLLFMSFYSMRITWFASPFMFLLSYFYLMGETPVLKDRVVFSFNFTIVSFLLSIPFMILSRIINKQNK